MPVSYKTRSFDQTLVGVECTESGQALRIVKCAGIVQLLCELESAESAFAEGLHCRSLNFGSLCRILAGTVNTQILSSYMAQQGQRNGTFKSCQWALCNIGGVIRCVASRQMCITEKAFFEKGILDFRTSTF